MIYSPVVGVNFRPAEAKEAIKTLSIGDTVELEAEPENPYDPNAVKVIAFGCFVGYLAKQNNGPVALALSEEQSYNAEVVSFENAYRPVLAITFED